MPLSNTGALAEINKTRTYFGTSKQPLSYKKFYK